MRPRFLPQNPEVRAAVRDLEERRDRGDDPPVIVRVVCHGKAIGQVWDLGSSRSLFVAKNERVRPTIVGGGNDPRRGDERFAVIEACFPEDEGDPVEEARMMPRWCPTDHRVLLARSELRDAVKRYRAHQGRLVTIVLRVEHNGRDDLIGVLASVK